MTKKHLKDLWIQEKLKWRVIRDQYWAYGSYIAKVVYNTQSKILPKICFVFLSSSFTGIFIRYYPLVLIYLVLYWLCLIWFESCVRRDTINLVQLAVRQQSEDNVSNGKGK